MKEIRRIEQSLRKEVVKETFQTRVTEARSEIFMKTLMGKFLLLLETLVKTSWRGKP
jgi:hypothetical protein